VGGGNAPFFGFWWFLDQGGGVIRLLKHAKIPCFKVVCNIIVIDMVGFQGYCICEFTIFSYFNVGL
jgi:hypothetical protein